MNAVIRGSHDIFMFNIFIQLLLFYENLVIMAKKNTFTSVVSVHPSVFTLITQDPTLKVTYIVLSGVVWTCVPIKSQ